MKNRILSEELDTYDEGPKHNRRSTDPWWISAIYKVGIPSAIACYLVWFLVTTVNAKIDKISELTATHIGDTLEAKKVNEQILYTLQRMCANAATTNQERNECWK